MQIGIYVAENILSDGSKTYDVLIQERETIRIAAVTLKDAEHLATKIHNAIQAHSCEEVTYDDVATFGTY